MNKNNTPFEVWWDHVVKLYKAGWRGYIPPDERVREFMTCEEVKSLYRKLYDEGHDPQWAFDAAY